MSSNYMDYGSGDHKAADQGCIWLFGCRSQNPWSRFWTAAYRLYARFVCDTKVPHVTDSTEEKTWLCFSKATRNCSIGHCWGLQTGPSQHVNITSSQVIAIVYEATVFILHSAEAFIATSVYLHWHLPLSALYLRCWCWLFTTAYAYHPSCTRAMFEHEVKLRINFRLRNDLYCVEWGVKLYSLTHQSESMHYCIIQKLTLKLYDKNWIELSFRSDGWAPPIFPNRAIPPHLLILPCTGVFNLLKLVHYCSEEGRRKQSVWLGLLQLHAYGSVAALSSA